MPTKPPKSLDDAYQQLQDLVSAFDRGDVKLEEAAAKFQQGADLAKYLKKHLQKIENQVTEVKASLDKDK